MNRQFERLLISLLIFLDLLALNLSNFLWQTSFDQDFSQLFIKAYNRYFLVSNGLWIGTAILLALYTMKVILDFGAFIKRTTQVFLLYLTVLLFYLFFSRELLVSRLFIVYSIFSFILSLVLIRFLFLGFQNYFRKNKELFRRVLILGFNDTALKLTEYLETEGHNIKLIGYTENENNIYQLSHYPILGNISSTVEYAAQMKVHEIFSTIIPKPNDEIYDIMKKAEQQCIKFKIVPNFNLFLEFNSSIEFYGNIPVLSRRNFVMDDLGNRIKKRLLDLVVSSLVIIFILSWLIPLLGIFIVMESGFPVFFRQQRTGLINKPFSCLKFRSMKKNKESDLVQTTEGDARITRVGRLLRHTSLDEFPQFINVFKGEMSLVGPRPHMLKHTKDYSKIVDEYMVRQFAKPGITGLAQIQGLRGEVRNENDIRQRVEKDLWYIEHWSLWLDVQIIFLTIYHVIRGDENAY